MQNPRAQLAMPLLTNSQRVSRRNLPLYRIWSFIHACWEHSQEWWLNTTNPNYLLSDESRRNLWPISMTIFFSFNLVCDVFDAQPIRVLFVDVIVIFVVAVGILALPRSTLWLDMLITSTVIGLFVFYSGNVSEDPGETFVAFMAFFLIFLAMMGVHSIALIASGPIVVPLVAYLYPGSRFMFVFLVMLVPSVIAVIIESHATSAHSLQALHDSNQSLLEHLSHGFCSVSMKTGTIQHASEKMQWLCGRELSDERLVNLLQPCDRERCGEFLEAACNQNILPILVTFDVPNVDKSFDVKLVPYSRSKGSLGLCFKIQGEIRTCVREDDDAQLEVLPEMHEEPPHGDTVAAQMISQGNAGNATAPLLSIRQPASRSQFMRSGQARSSDCSRSTSRSQGMEPIIEETIALETVHTVQFVPTPIRTISADIVGLADAWHLPEHTSIIEVARLAVELMEREADLSGVIPHTAGQCQQCFLLYNSEATECELCGANLT